jgi:hypothetical protein
MSELFIIDCNILSRGETFYNNKWHIWEVSTTKHRKIFSNLFTQWINWSSSLKSETCCIKDKYIEVNLIGLFKS